MKQRLIKRSTAFRRLYKQIAGCGFTREIRGENYLWYSETFRVMILGDNVDQPVKVYIAIREHFDRWANSRDFVVDGIPLDFSNVMDMVELLYVSDVYCKGLGSELILPVAVHSLHTISDMIYEETGYLTDNGIEFCVSPTFDVVGVSPDLKTLFVKQNPLRDKRNFLGYYKHVYRVTKVTKTNKTKLLVNNTAYGLCLIKRTIEK